MTARTRYQLAFLGMGWLILLGVLFHQSGGRLVSAAYRPVADRASVLAQKLSDAEGRAWSSVRGSSRREELASFHAAATVDLLRRPPQTLIGAFDGGLPATFEGFDRLEQALDYRFPVIAIYQAWGDQPEQQFPLRALETIDRLGSVPLVTWEPWVVDFDAARRTHLPPREEREYGALAGIARGDYNFYLSEWARAAAAYEKPLLLRFAHEMNDPYRYPWGPQNGNRPDDFIAAWRHVVEIFRAEGATNILWVWSPHISMPWFEHYYPGDAWVDWVGATVLNYGDSASWSRWWSFDQIFHKHYDTLASFGKPIVIAELASVGTGGDAAEWMRDALDQVEKKYPAVRMVVLFNQSHDATITPDALDWSVMQTPRMTGMVSRELATAFPSPAKHPGKS